MDNRAPLRPLAAFFRPMSAGLVMVAVAVPAPTLRAEFVVFTHGGVLKVKSHQVAGDRIRIDFHGGGNLTFDRALVDRIEEDEVTGTVAQVPSVQPPIQAVARAEAPRPALNQPATTLMDSQATSRTPEVSAENRPVPTPRRHSRRRR